MTTPPARLTPDAIWFGSLHRKRLAPPMMDRRYPWRSRQKRMTIAAGFVNRDGILLCADSQQEHGSTKFYSPKIADFSFPAGKIGFAFAGNSAFAVAAIQRCAERLKTIRNPDEVIPEVDRILERQYRKSVYAHPDRATDWAIPYWLLVAFYHPGRGAFLFATHETAMRSITNFECIGIGKDLGHSLVTPTYSPLLSEQQTIRLASYMINRVAACVPGVGGPSVILAMRNDGDTNFIYSQEASQVSDLAETFDREARALFFAAADNDLSNSDFEKQASAFVEWMKSYRQFWKAQREFVEEYGLKPTEQSDPQSTRADPLPPPPLPE